VDHFFSAEVDQIFSVAITSARATNHALAKALQNGTDFNIS